MPLRIQKLLTMPIWWLTIVCAVTLAPLPSSLWPIQSASAAAENAADTLGSDQVFKQLEELLRAFYPKAKVTKTDNSMHFEYKLKSETGFYSNKAILAPQDGGILGDLAVQPGEYAGEDKDRLPSVRPDGFHTILKMAPYSSANKDHLLVSLTFPSDASEEFKEKFKEIVGSFAPKQVSTAATQAVSNVAAAGTTQSPPPVATANSASPAAIVPTHSESASATSSASAAPPPSSASPPVTSNATAGSQPQGLHLFGPADTAGATGTAGTGAASGPPSFTKYGITLGGPAQGGRVIAAVKENSIAAEWGMQAGDVVISAQKPNFASLKAKRSGMTYEVNLTLNKAQFATMKHMSGQFAGLCTHPTVEFTGVNTATYKNDPMNTTFAVSAKGGLKGSYEEGGCKGYLDSCKMISDHQASFIWHDDFGYGRLTLAFNSDYSAFSGTWNFIECTNSVGLVRMFGPTSRTLLWSGRRTR